MLHRAAEWSSMNIIIKPLSFVLGIMYDFTKSYGLAIILFTFFVKMILLPLVMKQQKSMVMMQKAQPELMKIQQKYQNDKEKLNIETMKFYKENNISPFGGCLPLLIQLPIIYGLYRVVNQPLSYILNISKENIFKICEYLKGIGYEFANVTAKNVGNFEITIAQKMAGKIGEISEALGIGGLEEINFRFLKIFDLAEKPKLPSLDVFSNSQALMEYVKSPYFPLLLIPVLAGLLTYLQSKFTTTSQPAPQVKEGEANPAASMGAMTKIMPLMTVYITFMLPSGVGVYWIASSFIQIIQQVVLNKIYSKNPAEIVNTLKSGKEKKNGKNHRK